MKKEPIYVIGHKNPDSDSIVSSIAYSYLKNKMGYNTVACRLSNTNDETDYLLDKFGFELPELLKDARATLKEAELEPAFSISENATLFEALKAMEENGYPFIAITENKKIKGLITQNDIAHIGLGDTALSIDLLKNTSVEDITKTINGQIIYNDDQTILNGKVSIIALSEHPSLDFLTMNL